MTLITGASFGETAKASTLINRTAWYSCRAHSCCQYITLSAVFDPSCKDVYWSGTYTHWPNACTLGETKKYTSYARGTYTMYSSLITQWASLAFQSFTDTIYIYK